MNLYLSKKMLLSIALFTFLILISFVHNSLISNTLDEKLKKLHASGVYIEMLSQKNGIFVDRKNFVIRLDKVELVAELLFGIANNDPLLVHLSKLQGLKLNIELTHTKFIFSNELSMFISMNTLPEYFANQSLLFNDILEFSKENPKLIETTFNVWDNAFTFHIPKVKHTFNAENNISFNVDIEALSLEGYIKSHTDFDITNSCEKVLFSLEEKAETKVNIAIKNSLFNVIHLDKDLDTSLEVEAFDLNVNTDKNISLQLNALKATQSFIQDDMADISSILELENFKLKETKEMFSLNNLAYDIAFTHLDPKTVSDIKELIHTSNTNTVAFIFDDLSEDIASLIKHQATIKLNNFSFSDLYINNTHYDDAKLSFEAKSRPKNSKNPLELDMKMHLSHTLYQAFLDQVPNASLTLNYIKDLNSSVDFHLKLTEDGLILNNRNLFLLPTPADSNATDSNQTAQTITL